MKQRITNLALTALAVVALTGVVLTVPSPALAGGATQISGVGLFDPEGECVDPEGVGADFANIMTGDLEGCLYVFVGPTEDSPSGTYRETGAEIFVGSYNGKVGTFATTYFYTAKFDLAGQKFGRCQHPIVVGSGTGDFEGVTGRINFKDNVVAGQAVDFPFTGHLQW